MASASAARQNMTYLIRDTKTIHYATEFNEGLSICEQMPDSGALMFSSGQDIRDLASTLSEVRQKEALDIRPVLRRKHHGVWLRRVVMHL